MHVLAFAEQREGSIKKSSFETIQAARGVAEKLGARFTALLVGKEIKQEAAALGAYGAERVLVVEHARLASHSSTAVAHIITEVARREKATHLFLPASQMGKDLAPRVAVKLEAGLAGDCTELTVEDGEIRATRPIYAGKAQLSVRVRTPIKIYTLRPNVFTARAGEGTATVEPLELPLGEPEFAAVVRELKVASGRPDVTEADIIVSGGRGLKGPEHFHLIEELADVLGGAVGASRAVVDAGWRPHDEQVGQTGKTVAPTLYFACGISGAVQHLAGMSSSKYIVAVNKDKDAPIFSVADYGIVGDVFEIVPALTAELRKMLGK